MNINTEQLDTPLTGQRWRDNKTHMQLMHVSRQKHMTKTQNKTSQLWLCCKTCCMFREEISDSC